MKMFDSPTCFSPGYDFVSSQRSTACSCRFVECEPDVRQVCLTDQDSFVVLASDGLWDVMTDQEATDSVQVRPVNTMQQLYLGRHKSDMSCAAVLGLGSCWQTAIYIPSMTLYILFSSCFIFNPRHSSTYLSVVECVSAYAKARVRCFPARKLGFTLRSSMQCCSPSPHCNDVEHELSSWLQGYFSECICVEFQNALQLLCCQQVVRLLCCVF